MVRHQQLEAERDVISVEPINVRLVRAQQLSLCSIDERDFVGSSKALGVDGWRGAGLASGHRITTRTGWMKREFGHRLHWTRGSPADESLG
jgi:hypothetical protein